VAGLVNLFNPEVIVVGGRMAEAGELIMVPLREALDRCAIPSAAATVELRPAELGDEADVQGAITLASALSHLRATTAGVTNT
jgi:predicted NBD/HSP70 family sugar kinase